MLKKMILFLSIMLLGIYVIAQTSWIQKADYGGNACYRIHAIAIGNNAYCGMGSGATSSTTEFWSYDPSTNNWTQKANFPGTARGSIGAAFCIGNYGYFGLGGYWNGAPMGYSCDNEFYRYDPATNSWTQLADFPGVARHALTCFTAAGNGYVLGGITQAGVLLNDLWEYNPQNDTWTQKSSMGSFGRANAACFVIGRKAYCGTGRTSGGVLLNDFWEYDQALDLWTQKANFPAVARAYGSGFSLGSYGYMGLGLIGVTNTFKDMWKYDPSTNSWTQLPDLTGPARFSPGAFTIGNVAYVVGGCTSSLSYLDDLWEFTPGILGMEDAENEGSHRIWVDQSEQLHIISQGINDVYLYDVSGKLIKTEHFKSQDQILTCMSEFNNGVYLIRVITNNNSWSKKIVKCTY